MRKLYNLSGATLASAKVVLKQPEAIPSTAEVHTSRVKQISSGEWSPTNWKLSKVSHYEVPQFYQF